MEQEKPYISIVSVSRNDDHGGHLLDRMQYFIESLSEQCNRYKLKAELIIVEWNPPEDKKRFHEVLRFPDHGGYLESRVIVVPNKLHNTFENSDRIPLFQMIGKNIGVRRARGKFILATNIDILLSDELIEWISRQKLVNGIIYRTDRYDISLPPSGTNPLDQVQNRIVRVYRRNYTWPVREKFYPISFFFDYFLIYLHKTYRRFRYGEPFLHLNSAGDFTLMSRKDWFLVRGYPEFPIFSLHLDGVLCYIAYYNNIHEIFLQYPCIIYHLDHEVGSGISPGIGSKILIERLRREGIPSFRYRDLIRCADELRSMGKPATFNPLTWGFGNIMLEEKRPR